MFDTIGHGYVVEYREEPCRSALNPVKGMGFSWSLNPYTGCATAAPSATCALSSCGPTGPRTTARPRIRVKSTWPRCCAASCAESWQRETVVIGAATDPTARGGPLQADPPVPSGPARVFESDCLITRGPMIVRDIDVLFAGLARRGLHHLHHPHPGPGGLAPDRTGHGSAEAAAARNQRSSSTPASTASVGMAPILPGAERQARAPGRRRPRGA